VPPYDAIKHVGVVP